MKRFLLFVFDEFYPRGGWNDFVDSYETLEAAQARARTRRSDFYQIVDQTLGEVVEENL